MSRAMLWFYAGTLAVLAGLFGVAVAATEQDAADEVRVRLERLAPGSGVSSIFSEDGAALRLVGHVPGRAVAGARLHFVLPDADPGQSRWVVWMGRAAASRVELAGEGWRGASHDFYAPTEGDGLLSTGYMFPLPGDWTGSRVLELRAVGEGPTALRPRVMRESAAMRLEQRGSIFSAVIYAALFTLGALMLALYSAARDRLYLVFFATSVSALLLIAADNGHLYDVPMLGQLGGWRGQGQWALALLFLASMLQLLKRYTPAARVWPRYSRAIDGFCVLVGIGAAVCLLGLQATAPWAPRVGSALWVLGTLAGASLLAFAERRRERRVRAVALLLVTTASLVLAAAFLQPGRWVDVAWLRYGYQIAFVGAAAVLSIGLVGRIAEFRNQRDQDRLARVDSEKRMRREAARADLNAALQAKLLTLGSGDVEWAALRVLLEHLGPLMQAELAVAMAYGYQGQDILVVSPASRKAEGDALAGRRRVQLKRQAATAIPLQQPVVAAAGEDGVAAMEALVPLPIRAPAWGMVVLQRPGEELFGNEELALAGELARLTLLHIEQSLAAIKLRRSAELDALTGAFNRRTIDQWTARCFAEADRDGRPISVLFADMDHFKRINDEFGHACGDECLRRVAAALQANLAQGDLLGRYGGEEFIVVLPGRGGAPAREIGEQMRAAVERLELEWEGQKVPLTVSVGMATRVAGEDDPASLIDRADKALYAAKRNGRNCVQVAPAMFGPAAAEAVR
jgi:diguanylate cyclase (GGDEF)-like protein